MSNFINGDGAGTTGRSSPGTSRQKRLRPFEAAASRLTPNGSHTNSKRPSAFYGNVIPETVPIFARWACGAEMVDCCGKTYIDMLMALGAVTLGYRHPAVHDAVRQALSDGGGVYSLPSQQECKTGELVLKHVAPWAEQVRFVKTGSEAVHGAYRIAKRSTGLRHIIAMKGSYHGWHEWCDLVRRVPYGSHPKTWVDSGWKRYRKYAEDNSWSIIAPWTIAAVIIEPLRWGTTDIFWLRDVRQWCDDNKVLLVFDEMIYGFRHALGGATELYGVTPDLACYGKGMSNGMACACVVGKADVMQHADVMSGTYSGDTTGLAAAAATIQTYVDQDIIGVLGERGRQLWDGLTQVFGDGSIEGRPAHLRINHPLRPTASSVDQVFAKEMAKRGVLWHPACANVSAAHTKDQIDKVVDAAAAIYKELQ